MRCRADGDRNRRGARRSPGGQGIFAESAMANGKVGSGGASPSPGRGRRARLL